MNPRIFNKCSYNEATRSWGGLSLAVTIAPYFRLRYLIQAALVGAAYVGSAYLAFSIESVNTFAAPLFPASGVAIAALLYLGFRVAPAIALGALVLNYTLGAPISACIAIALGNTGEALLGTYLLRNFRFQPYFNRVSDSVSFIAVALSVSLVSAIIGPLALVVTGEISALSLPHTSVTWWIGDVLGILIVGSFLIKWFARSFNHIERSVWQWLETIAFFSTTALVSVLVFLDPIAEISPILAPYLLFVPLTWGALRVGPRFVLAALLTVTAIASLGTAWGTGSFVTGGEYAILLLQLFIATIGMIFLPFVAAIEERKQAARHLQEHVVSLEENVQEISEADRAKNEFIAILSHELRNPLAPVLSSLDLLRLKYGDRSDLKETFDAMYTHISRVTRLLDDLLDITRITKKKFNLEIKRVHIGDILAHSVETVKTILEKNAHTLTVAIPESPLVVEADPLRLEQVFVNLLNNAAKYTPRGGTITVHAEQDDNRVTISVKDSGIGIPPEMLRSIFEPFRQIRRPGDTTAGLGIGLSLSQRFVEMHGGSIVARSEGMSRGSEFIVSLPLASKPETPTPTKPPEVNPPLLAPPKKKQRSVLIVDDNEAAANGIAQLLSHAGHSAHVAYTGADAVHKASTNNFDIIFLDIGLPDTNGYDLATQLRSIIPSHTRVIALTGYGQEEDERRAHEAGFDQHLTKPVSIADLEKILGG